MNTDCLVFTTSCASQTLRIQNQQTHNKAQPSRSTDPTTPIKPFSLWLDPQQALHSMAGVIDSPLFSKVHQRIHNSRAPRQLTEDEQAEIGYAWDKLSAGQQTVAPRHVKIALRAMGFQINKAEVQELLQQHGLQPEAGIPWLAFKEVLTTKLLERSPQDELRRAFTLFDLQQSGRITTKDLALIARQLQVDIEPQELQDMVAEFDKDGDNAINEEEFKAIMAAAND